MITLEAVASQAETTIKTIGTKDDFLPEFFCYKCNAYFLEKIALDNHVRNHYNARSFLEPERENSAANLASLEEVLRGRDITPSGNVASSDVTPATQRYMARMQQWSRPSPSPSGRYMRDRKIPVVVLPRIETDDETPMEIAPPEQEIEGEPVKEIKNDGPHGVVKGQKAEGDLKKTDSEDSPRSENEDGKGQNPVASQADTVTLKISSRTSLVGTWINRDDRTPDLERDLSGDKTDEGENETTSEAGKAMDLSIPGTSWNRLNENKERITSALPPDVVRVVENAINAFKESIK